MSKELIVSVNGREKKIAIIENGNVTEFYIERGEGNQGIVGNIYKGRVMRVLPGMQSAFVDIGLERDAFLYVSDFFDEEEEFERIVVDNKAKGDGGAAASEAARMAAAEKLERARLERERQMETAQERAEPLSVKGGASAEVEDDEDDEVERFEPAAEDAMEFAPRAATPAIDDREASGGRGRRDRGRGRGREQRETRSEETRSPMLQQQREQPLSSSAASSAEPAGSFVEEVQARLAAREEIETPFAAVGNSFNRIVDEDEAAAGDGEMFKDARLQERILDQIHAVEFDLETPAEAEIGSLFSGVKAAGDSSFQRIDDSDEAGDAAPRRLEAVQPAVAAAVASFTDDALAESPVAMSAAPQAFERVSDDEKVVEALPLPAGDEVPASAKRGSRSRKAGGARARKGAEDQSPADETT
ncbi:MAG: hypothetical protein M3Q76_07095, partial [Acidobacteriota bacterium]|nr:hypothetical protein [Acidobacteriota bacterium]